MNKPSTPAHRFPTAVLLSCAAIGVAGGLLLAPMNWLSTGLLAAVPFFAVAILGLWMLPAVVALRLLRRPLVGILTGLISGLVIVPFSGYGFGSVLSNLSFAAFAELPFLLLLWRRWGTGLHYAGAMLQGLVYPFAAWQLLGLALQPPWVGIAAVALSVASCLAATALGILIADRLRRTGVGPR